MKTMTTDTMVIEHNDDVMFNDQHATGNNDVTSFRGDVPNGVNTMTNDNEKTVYAVEHRDGTTTVVRGDDALNDNDIVYAVDTDTMDTVVDNESGQGLVEYGLILMLVAFVVICFIAICAPAIGNVFSALMIVTL